MYLADQITLGGLVREDSDCTFLSNMYRDNLPYLLFRQSTTTNVLSMIGKKLIKISINIERCTFAATETLLAYLNLESDQ